MVSRITVFCVISSELVEDHSRTACFFIFFVLFSSPYPFSPSARSTSKEVVTPQQPQRPPPRAPLHHPKTISSDYSGAPTTRRSSPNPESTHRRSPRTPLQEVTHRCGSLSLQLLRESSVQSLQRRARFLSYQQGTRGRWVLRLEGKGTRGRSSGQAI